MVLLLVLLNVLLFVKSLSHVCPLQDVKGSRGLQEIPTLSPSKETKGNQDPQASTAFLDHEVRAVTIEITVRVLQGHDV